MQNNLYKMPNTMGGDLESYQQSLSQSQQCSQFNYSGYYQYYPYTPQIDYHITTTTSANLEPHYEIKVEKVENGFIVHKDGKKFIVTKPEDIVQFLKDGNG